MLDLNKDHVGTSTYLALKDQEHYNAFLFGSSRTLAFRLKDWKAHLPADAVPFAFDAHKESLFGIRGKVRLIDASGGQLDHAILVICPDQTFAPFRNSEGALCIKDPTDLRREHLCLSQDHAGRLLRRSLLREVP